MNGKILVLAITMLAITSCGGGGDSVFPNGSQGNVSTQENAVQLSNVNGSLRGLYFSSTSLAEGEWLNLETGESGSLYDSSGHKPANLEVIVPAPFGTEYLELYQVDSFGSAGTGIISLKDWRTGLVVQEFQVPGNVSTLASSIRYSPDGQIIGLRRDEFDTFDYTLAFYRRTGELIAEFADDSVSVYEWLLDGRFIFYRDGWLRVATLSQGSILTQPLLSLERIPGTPRNIKVSPDGNYMVFEMVTAVPPFLAAVNYRNASVYRAKTDGSELTLVGTMVNSTGLSTDEPRVNNPLWSLDGQFLMMSVGVSSAAVIFWEQSYSSVTDDYEPLFITDVIVANSEGFMYLLPNYATDVVFLNGQARPTVAYNNSGAPAPYPVSALHIEPGAVLVEAVERLPEAIITPSGQTGFLLYLKDSYEDAFDNNFTVMAFDARTAQERVLFQVAGRDYDDASYFGVSNSNQYFAMWDRQSYDEMYLRVFDSAGTELTFFEMVYYNSGTKGRRLLSAPQFSPVNDSLLLYRFVDEETDQAGFGVLDWTTGKYRVLETSDVQSVAWAPDGSIVASQDNNVYWIGYVNKEFTNSQLLFSTLNPASYLNVHPSGEKLVYVMSGHVFHSNMDGTGTFQITAPSTGFESNPVWSPDGRNIALMKGERRYVVSAESRNLRIYPNVSENTSRLQHVTREGSSIGYWRP